MAIIPQFNAGGPAQSQAPVMEQGQGGIRLDASGELSALGGLANNLARGFRPLENAPDDLGQGFFRGVSAIGDGVKDVGQAIFGIRKRVAEARNLRDVYDAQVAMEREAGEFEKWKVLEPDPSKWEEEWTSRISAFGDGYLASKELSPAAKEGVMVRLNAFAERQAVAVGVDAVRTQTKLAADASRAFYLRAVDEGDLDSAVAHARNGFHQGLIAEDEAVRMELNAKDAIEAKAITTGMQRVETRLLYGDIEGAREELRQLPIPEDEKALQFAKIETRHAVQAKASALEEEAYLDPLNVAKRLEAKGPDGLPANDRELPGAMREQLLKLSYEKHHEERQAVFSQVIADIDAGAVESEDALKQALWGTEATEKERAALVARYQGVTVENAKETRRLQSQVAGYDPAQDPYGKNLDALKTEIMLSIPDGGAKEKIVEELGRRASGEIMTMLERTKTEMFSQLDKSLEAEGSWKLSTDQIKRAEKDGGVFYVDTKAEVKTGDPGYFETGKGWVRGLLTFGALGDGKHVKGRILELSQDDKLKIEAGKPAIVEDLGKMREQYREADRIRETLEQEINTGEIKTADDLKARFDTLTGEKRAEAAKKIVEEQLSGMAVLPADMASPENTGLWGDPSSVSAWIDAYPIP